MMMRSLSLLLLLATLLTLAAGRRIPPTVNNKKTSSAGGRWGTPTSVLEMGLPLEEDLAKDLESTSTTEKQDKVKQVKAVKKAKLVASPPAGPMPGPSLFAFPPIIGLE